jgi:precorrin-4 C11-methyltransferase
MNAQSAGKVIFIGAGPGDVELISVRGQKAIANADVILYAGSLIAPQILDYAGEDIPRHNTARMPLDQQLGIMIPAVQAGKQVVRLHTGDPSVYGAIDEQIQALKEADIPFEIIPGISSVFAAAAALGLEFTLPEITQTLILTRVSGKTPVPELENLRALAKHRNSMAIFLSTGLIETVVQELLAADYVEQTPIAVVYRASWPDQRIIRGTLASIAKQLNEFEITHQSLIILSPALENERKNVSHLYGSHQKHARKRNGSAILVLTEPAYQMGLKLVQELPDAKLFVPDKLLSQQDTQTNIVGFQHGIRQIMQEIFLQYESLICIMASGIVVREIAPLVSSKHHDPGVIVMDAYGKHIISLLSGHEGGANELAQQIAGITGGTPVITTASDNENLPALDVIAKKNHWKIDKRSNLAGVMAALVNKETIALYNEENIVSTPELAKFPFISTESNNNFEALIHIGFHKIDNIQITENIPFVIYYPPVLTVGIGCNRGTSAEEILEAIEYTFAKHHLALESIACLASVTEKADEAGLLSASDTLQLPLEIFTHTQILEIKNIPTPSDYAMKALGIPGVAEPCAMLAAESDALIVKKQKYANVTVAVALKGAAQ